MVKEFIIATFNLENLDKSKENWPVRCTVLRAMLQRIQANILFLQEVKDLESLNALLDGLAFYKDHEKAITVKDNKPFPNRNLVTLSQYHIEEREQYHHKLLDRPAWKIMTSDPPQEKAEPITWERPILYCKIKLTENRFLHAINLHLKSKNPTTIKKRKEGWKWLTHEAWAEGYFLSAVKRVGQALETRRLLDRLMKDKPEEQFVAVGGDFNADIGEVPYKTIVGSIPDTNNPALRSTVMVPCELNVPAEQRYSLIYHGKGEMIDHIIVSQALYPYWIETDIFNELLPDESIAFASEIKFPESDHAPVIARFRFPDT